MASGKKPAVCVGQQLLVEDMSLVFVHIK